MLHIIQSNRMETLSQQFIHLLASAPLDSVFAKEVVLVQSPGMAQWLKLQVTQTTGFCAQMEFPLPSSFIWQLYQQILPDVPAESAFNKTNMAWKLYHLLPQKLNNPLYAALAQYLRHDSDGLIRFSLCEKIADVFDQYLMYRPDWLTQWQAQNDEPAGVKLHYAPWQPDLWRSLVSYTEQLGQSGYHRANMQHIALEKLATQEVNLPQRISVFGISALPQGQLDILEALAKHTDVLLFLFNPSEHYWGDVVDEKTQAKIKARYQLMPQLSAKQRAEQIDQAHYFSVGNPLLSSWGKLGRDYLEQLLQLDAKWIDGFVAEFPDTLLGQIQQEIYQLAFKQQSLVDDPTWFVNDTGRIALNETDTSIQLSDCHTPLREIERLHDYLLQQFEQDPSLTPKDIIVMMPDVGQYSPYIEAVFGGASQGRYIPYALADLAISQEKPLFNAIVQLCDLPYSRFGVTQILDLLQIPAISSQLDLSEQDILQCRYWLEQVGVKWGINGEHKGEFDLPQHDLNSWQHGLTRLILGFAKPQGHAFHGVYGADEIEGMASETASKLLEFIEQLIVAKQQLAPDDTLANKAQQLQQIIQRLFAVERLDSHDVQLIDKLVSSLSHHHDNQDYQGEVSQRVVSYLVKQNLEEKGVGQRFLIGSVNFCTLMPMRAVPFKQVCILGLNDSDYPRNVQPIGFDLVQHSPRRKGDRSRRLDDRYLFLEALLSAQNNLYLSYVGRSCHDNQPRLPSLLLSELLDYIKRSFYYPNSDKTLPENLIAKQHLQPFHHDYYQKDHRWQSYNPTWLIGDTQREESPETPLIAPSELTTLELSDFLTACTKPQQYFYQQIIGINLGQIAEIEDDNEPFALDALKRYNLLDELLAQAVKNQPINEAELLQRGVLAQANVGKLEINNLQSKVAHLASAIQSYTTLACQTRQEVNVTVDKITIQGWLQTIYGDHLVFYRPAKIKAKDRIVGYLHHLLAACSGEAFSTVIIGLDMQVTFAPIEKASAEKQLSQWLMLVNTARTRPVAFFPASGWQYLATQDIAKAEQAFSGGQYIGKGEGENPYIALNYQHLTPHQHEFINWSEQLLATIYQQGEERKHANP